MMGADRIVGLASRFRSEEDGASLMLVAISLVWIVGLASLVVDVGAGWLTRQSLIPATDAAALAAAQDLVADPSAGNAACVTARTYVLANAPDAVMLSCDVALFPDGGRVSVSASDKVDPAFTEVETGELAIGSVSSATWGPPLTVSGLRPLAICYDGSADLQLLIDTPPSSPTTVTVHFLKDDPDACGVTSLGNFATVDFEAGSTSQEIRNWMRDGFGDGLDFDPATVLDCQGTAVCYDRPYASDAIMPELLSLRSSGEKISIPVFNFADDFELHLIGMFRASLQDFQLSGPPEDWWMELEVAPGLVTGTCCGPPAMRSGNQVIAICGVDADAFTACEPSS